MYPLFFYFLKKQCNGVWLPLNWYSCTWKVMASEKTDVLSKQLLASIKNCPYSGNAILFNVFQCSITGLLSNEREWNHFDNW